MTTLQDLQAEHEALLKRQEAPDDPAQFWADVQTFIDRARAAAENIPAPRERDQLRAILRFWASYIFDQTKTYPDTTMRPAKKEDRVTPPPPTPRLPPPPPEPHRTPVVVWAIAALAILAIVIAVIALNTGQGGTGQTPASALPDRVATQAHEQIMVNAAMTEVIAASSTPTDIPTSTPTVTSTPRPTETPVPPTPTPGSVPPTPQVVPLDMEYQILTQGPSPFDATVWVIQLRLVGIGGNGSYIYWVDGQQLPDAEYTVQGKSCEPQLFSIGVTSSGQAVKRDIVLNSPLIACLK
jgi:hypothetical protein